MARNRLVLGVAAALLGTGCTDTPTECDRFEFPPGLVPNFYSPIARAGTGTYQAVEIEGHDPRNIGRVFTRPFEGAIIAAVDDERIATIDQVESGRIVVRGSQTGTTNIRLKCSGPAIVNSEEAQYGPVQTVDVLPLDRISFDSPWFARSGVRFPEKLDGDQVAFAPGGFHVGVALWSGADSPIRLRDSSMQVDAPVPSQFYNDDMTAFLTFVDAPVGVYEVHVKAGDKRRTLPLVVTDTVDSVHPWLPPSTIPPLGFKDVCFAAEYQGRYVFNLYWSYTVNGVPDGSDDECLRVFATNTTGPITISASVAGMTTSATLTVE